MIRKTYLRPVLLVAVLAVAPVPPAAAQASAPAHCAGSVASRWTGRGHLFHFEWHWLTSLWGQEGSSMDPFGNH